MTLPESFGFSLYYAFISIVSALFSVYLGVTLFMKQTRDIDEWKELKKNNVSVGIILTSVIIATALIVQYGLIIAFSFSDFSFAKNSLAKILLPLVNVTLASIAAFAVIYLSIRFMDKLTVEIDELAQIKKGNVAVALFMGATVISAALVSQYAIGMVMQNIDFFILGVLSQSIIF